jgi:thiamine monophosphate kinase
MTKKETFIKFIEVAIKIAEDEITYINGINEKYNITTDDYNIAMEFWEDYKKCLTPPKDMTENGLKVLTWMREHIEEMSNVFTAKEIGEGLFTSGRSISGSMKKLVNDGYVEKIGKNPVQYSLTETGKLYHIDN